MPENIPFEKKELIVIVHNPNNLPVIDFHELKELQGDLKITTPAKIEKLKSSIIKYGVFVPKFVWIDNNTYHIEDGHQTVRALMELEKGGYMVPPIPYVEIQARDRKDAGEKLLMINSRFADINPETSFFKDFDIGLEFMEEIEIPELELDFEGLEEEIVEDEVPEVPEEPVTQVGDLWLLGKHRVLCGDTTKAEDVERLMDGKKADMMFTDPPYNIGIKYINYQDKDEDYWNKVDIWMGLIKSIAKGHFSIYIKQYAFNLLNALLSFVKAEFEVKNVIIWKSQSMAHPTSNYDNAYEIIIYGIEGTPLFNTWGEKREKPDNYWSGEGIEFKGKMSNIWADIAPVSAGCISMSDMETIDNQKQHITEMPIKLPARTIKFSSKENDIIADFFLGSGTTLIAAHQLNRICYGMELEPKYIDVTCQRFFNLTGIDPVRESDGKKWSELQQK